MNGLNLKDVTFLIPLRIDSVKRLENTLVVVDYLLNHFDTQVKILEATGRDTGILKALLPEKVNHYFVEDYDEIFHRTKYINKLVESCETCFVSVWDADVIIPISQIEETMRLLRSEEAQFVTPFQDNFLDTSYILRDLYIHTRDINVLINHRGKMISLYNPNPVGGVFFANRKSYIKSGMENERFYGWGREDGDRVNRWKILGYNHTHVKGLLFHLTHERGINSAFHSPNQIDIKSAELIRTLAMSREEMEDELGHSGRWNGSEIVVQGE